jgi:hypothetical protein
MFYTPEQYYEHHYSDGSRKSSAMGGGEVIYTGCISDVFTRPTIRKANMSYSTDPVSDADRHTDAQDAFTERLDAEIASVTEIYKRHFLSNAWIYTCRCAKGKPQLAQRMRRSGCCLIQN